MIFSNFAESLAEARGKARAQSLKNTRTEAYANKIIKDNKIERVSALALRREDLVMIKEEKLPSDGDIMEGTGLVDESAITGESAPVIRESGGDISGVTGGTKLLSGKIEVRITVESRGNFPG